MKQEESFGTPSHMLHYKDGAETSKAAAEQVDTTKLERMVYEVIEDIGVDGAISDQIRTRLPEVSYNSITPRFAALKRKGWIYCNGETRPGESQRQQWVMKVNRRKINKHVWKDRRAQIPIPLPIEEPICSSCGSTDVLRDAWGMWDIDKQDWVLQNVFDAAFCNNCDGECSITMRKIE